MDYLKEMMKSYRSSIRTKGLTLQLGENEAMSSSLRVTDFNIIGLDSVGESSLLIPHDK